MTLPPTARSFILAFVGLLCFQAAWILVVPPFRGLDEHEHAFKAAAVARGDWSATHQPSSQEWGEFVVVPHHLVRAAHPVCESLPYTTRHNCVGLSHDEPGMVRVASSAARYNPAFYAVTGAVSLPFEGTGSLYTMRIAAAVMCALLLAAAVAVTYSSARSAWLGTGLVLAMTPTLLYSTSVAAPNGIEAAAAVLLWTVLLAIVRRRARPPLGGLVVLATLAAVPLAVVRGMGPVWLLLIVCTVALLTHWGLIGSLARHRGVQVSAALAVVATLLACGWILAADATDTGSPGAEDASAWNTLSAQVVLWVIQAMAAFPARDEIANPSLYVIGFIGWWVFVAIGTRIASWRERGVMAVVLTLSILIPASITVLTYDSLGPAWQGRYGYPYSVGLLLICGHVLDRAARGARPRVQWPLWLAVCALMAMSLIGQLGVLAGEATTSPLAGTDGWVQPTELQIVVLNLVGLVLLARALTLPRVSSTDLTTLPPWRGSARTGSPSLAGPAARS